MYLQNLVILAQTAHEIHSSPPSDAGFSNRSLNLHDCQQEEVSDVIAGVVDQDVGVNVCANFVDSRLKPTGRHFRPFFERRLLPPVVHIGVMPGLL